MLKSKKQIYNYSTKILATTSAGERFASSFGVDIVIKGVYKIINNDITILCDIISLNSNYPNISFKFIIKDNDIVSGVNTFITFMKIPFGWLYHLCYILYKEDK